MQRYCFIGNNSYFCITNSVTPHRGVEQLVARWAQVIAKISSDLITKVMVAKFTYSKPQAIKRMAINLTEGCIRGNSYVNLAKFGEASKDGNPEPSFQRKLIEGVETGEQVP